ncbi:hypothetical protein [Gloeocapsa sp. PCC 7428]|uniref:hypothetical protein n=1 Tax=Gloeocapsa sp. PCC 7428 TaxID=1173026 RepID=UPI00350FEB60
MRRILLGIVIISITTQCDMDCAIGLPIGSILVFIDMYRYVTQGVYPVDWGLQGKMVLPIDVWDG